MAGFFSRLFFGSEPQAPVVAPSVDFTDEQAAGDLNECAVHVGDAMEVARISAQIEESRKAISLNQGFAYTQAAATAITFAPLLVTAPSAVLLAAGAVAGAAMCDRYQGNVGYPTARATLGVVAVCGVCASPASATVKVMAQAAMFNPLSNGTTSSKVVFAASVAAAPVAPLAPVAFAALGSAHNYLLGREDALTAVAGNLAHIGNNVIQTAHTFVEGGDKVYFHAQEVAKASSRGVSL